MCKKTVVSDFSCQGGERHKFSNSNPFVEEDMEKSEVASVAYRCVLPPTVYSLSLSIG